MIPLSRRAAMASALAALPAFALTGFDTVLAADEPRDPLKGLKLGIATYSFRKLNVDLAVKATARVGVKYASLKEAHLPLKSTTEQRKAVADKFRKAGVTLLSAGVITLDNDEAACRNAFEYVRDIGAPTIVANPNPRGLPLVEKLAKEFDIRVAIHNHGPEDRQWPTPISVYDSVNAMDERMGMCIDVGHTARAGADPAEAISRLKDRVFDIHLKDVSDLKSRSASGEVELGRGVMNIKAILAALVKIGYKHHVGLEHERDSDDPIPGVAESIGYARAILAAME